MVRPLSPWPGARATRAGRQTPAESEEQRGAIDVSRRALLGGVVAAAAMPAAALARPAGGIRYVVRLQGAARLRSQLLSMEEQITAALRAAIQNEADRLADQIRFGPWPSELDQDEADA